MSLTYCATCAGQIVGGPQLGWVHAGPAELGHGATADADHAATPRVPVADSVDGLAAEFARWQLAHDVLMDWAEGVSDLPSLIEAGWLDEDEDDQDDADEGPGGELIDGSFGEAVELLSRAMRLLGVSVDEVAP